MHLGDLPFSVRLDAGTGWCTIAIPGFGGTTPIPPAPAGFVERETGFATGC